MDECYRVYEHKCASQKENSNTEIHQTPEKSQSILDYEKIVNVPKITNSNTKGRQTNPPGKLRPRNSDHLLSLKSELNYSNTMSSTTSSIL